MRSLLLACSLLAGLLTLAAPAAHAQNASTAGTLELYPTLQSVGVRLAYTGDVNNNARAYLEWRHQGTSAWRRGVDLVRITSSRWAGSVLWCQPSVRYDVRAVIVDPDGGATATGSIRTRNEPQREAGGRTWWVSSSGDDSDDGSKDFPLASIQVAADRANPADEIRVKAGVYYQQLDVSRSGSEQLMYHLVADGPGVVLDGSDPLLLRRTDWRSDGGDVYSLPFTGITRLVSVDSDRRLYRQSSLANLQANENGMSDAWTIEGGRLYVKLSDSTSPVSHTMHVARYNWAIKLGMDYWRVNGLEIRYYGTGASDGAPSGITIAGGDRNVVSNNHVHTIGGDGIHVRNGGAENLIEKNLFRDPRIGTWPRINCKAHEEEIQAISLRGGRGNVVRSNFCQGFFDGVDTQDDVGSEDSSADTDIYDNKITETPDDGIEPEEVSGINVRIWRNWIEGSFNGFSIAPNKQGPTYILFNTVVNYQRSAFKFSYASSGHNIIAHNTCTSNVAGTASVWPTGEYSNNHFRNNILNGNESAPISDDAGESDVGNDFNGNLLYTTDPTLFRWKGVNYPTITSLRSATGFETAGMAGTPVFRSPSTGDYTLVSGLGLNTGLALPGINDCYAGSKPDVGSGDFCVSMPLDATPIAVPDAGQELWLSSPFPNPGRGLFTMRFGMPWRGPVNLSVFDAMGRRIRTMIDSELAPGGYTERWDGTDDHGRPVGNGVFFVRLTTPEASRATRLVMLK